MTTFLWNTRRQQIKAVLLTGALCLVLAIAAAADGPARNAKSDADLAGLSLEDLMNVKVESASRHLQRANDTPAAAYVITQEDIRRSGLSSIPELLRLAPGMDVQRTNSGGWSITCRGFNGTFANKLLVMIDGRSVYTTLYGGVYWDAQDVPLEDIERIEIIRGPGATMWGANAVNGIVNVITKKASDSATRLLVQGRDGERPNLSELQYSSSIRNGSYRVYAKDSAWNSLTTATGANANDQWDQARAGFRADFGQPDDGALTIQGDVYHGLMHLPVSHATLTSPYNAIVDNGTTNSGGNVLIKWAPKPSPTSSTQMQAYIDRTKRNDINLGETRSTYDIGIQQQDGLGRKHEFTWGLGYRYTHSQLLSTPNAFWTPAFRGESLYSAFVQDEIHVSGEQFHVIVGSKVEHNDYTGFEVEPNIRFLWSPSDHKSAWASVSRAVRTPTQTDSDGTVLIAAIPPNPRSPLPIALELAGNPNMESEVLVAYELGYRVQPSSRTSFDVTGFYNVYDNLSMRNRQAPYMDPLPIPHMDMPMVVGNQMYGHVYGAELVGNWAVNEKWRLSASLSKLLIDLHMDPSNTGTTLAPAEDQGSPRTRLNLGSYLDLPHGMQLDTLLLCNSSFGSGAVPAWARLDVRLGWTRPNGMQISIGAQDLFGDSHREYATSTYGGEANVGRNLYSRVTWKY